MSKATWLNVNGAWKQAKNIWMNVGGVWKQKVMLKGNINNTWKDYISYNLYNVKINKIITKTGSTCPCLLDNDYSLYIVDYANSGQYSGYAMIKKIDKLGTIIYYQVLTNSPTYIIKYIYKYGQYIYLYGDDGSRTYTLYKIDSITGIVVTNKTYSVSLAKATPIVVDNTGIYIMDGISTLVYDINSLLLIKTISQFTGKIYAISTKNEIVYVPFQSPTILCLTNSDKTEYTMHKVTSGSYNALYNIVDATIDNTGNLYTSAWNGVTRWDMIANTGSKSVLYKNEKWQINFDSSVNRNDICAIVAIKTDIDGNVYVLGHNNAWDSGNDEYLINKYDTNGIKIYSYQFDDSVGDLTSFDIYGNTIVVNSRNNVYQLLQY